MSELPYEHQIEKIIDVHSENDSKSKLERYPEPFQLSLEGQRWTKDDIAENKNPTSLKEECSSVRCNGGTCHHQVNTKLTPSKRQKKEALLNLKKCTYRTPPIQMATFLEQLFKDYPSEQGWWLYVARNWTHRPINRVLAYMIKRHQGGWSSIRNPSAYFTDRIKYRKRRKKPTGTIGTYKHQKERRQDGFKKDTRQVETRI